MQQCNGHEGNGYETNVHESNSPERKSPETKHSIVDYRLCVRVSGLKFAI